MKKLLLSMMALGSLNLSAQDYKSYPVSLKPGESRLVSFTIPPEQLSLVSEGGDSYQPSGKAIISIGGG